MSDSAAKIFCPSTDAMRMLLPASARAPCSRKSWLDKFISVMGGQGSIVDIGCGNGQPIAGYFIQQGFHLTGVDGSSATLARA